MCHDRHTRIYVPYIQSIAKFAHLLVTKFYRLESHCEVRADVLIWGPERNKFLEVFFFPEIFFTSNTIISFYLRGGGRERILSKCPDLVSHGILKAYCRQRLQVCRFNPRERKLRFPPFIHEPCSWQRLHSGSNYTEQMRDFLIFFFYFDLQLNKICLFYFWLKMMRQQRPWFHPRAVDFSPSFVICFRLRVHGVSF